MGKVHYEIRLQGQVQGVGLRYEVKERADKLGIYGYARNLRDGSVIIEVEGPESLLKKFLEWCRDGSSLADVEQVDFEQGAIKGYREFSMY